MKAIGIHKNSDISERAIVCSQHFSEDNFDRTSACGILRLRSHAIPNIFNMCCQEQCGLEGISSFSEDIVNHESNLNDQYQLVAATDHSSRSTSSDISTQTCEVILYFY